MTVLRPRSSRPLLLLLLAGASGATWVPAQGAAPAALQGGEAATDETNDRRPGAQAGRKPLTVQQGLGLRGAARPSWLRRPPNARWAADGRHVLLSSAEGRIRIDPVTGQRVDPPTLPATTEQAAPTRPNPRQPGRRRRGTSTGVRLVQNALVLGRGKTERKLTTGAGSAKRIPTLSPSKRHASFVRNGELVVLDIPKDTAAQPTEWQVTNDGDPAQLDGVLDWVYQEELYGRGNFRGHWWSGDGKAVAFLRLDERPVRDFYVIDHVPNGALKSERRVRPEPMKYPKAGDPNPTVSLSIAWPESREVVDVDLLDTPADRLIVHVTWAPGSDGKTGDLIYMVQDRIQTWLRLVRVDPKTGESRELLREESKTWVYRGELPRFLPDGSFLWQSDRTGYRHLYHYSGEGKLLRAVTGTPQDEWQVTRVVRVGDLGGRTWLWFEATKDGAINRNLYRTPLDGGPMPAAPNGSDERIQRLTHGPGRHSTQLNTAGTWLIDTVSSVESLPEVRVGPANGDARAVRVLGQAKVGPAMAEYGYAPKQRLTIRARDGYPLDATIIKPLSAPAGNGHPIYLPTYSGPNAPSVRNQFSVSTFQQFLAQRGFLTLQVNVRSASGRGIAHTGTCYKQLGVQELMDLEDAVAFACKEHGGDPERVAVDGWSYGGFMAAYALTHSDKFALGIAGAGVHDWQYYDTIYTERYMSTPQKNPDGYAKTSVIGAAKNLKGHLVIMHGTMDDNVHLQNSIHLVHALLEADHDNFELMLYPKSRHGVRSLHRNKLKWKALSRMLQ